MIRLKDGTRRLSRFLWKETLWASFTVFFGLLLGTLAIYAYGTPSVASVAHFPLDQTTILYDRTGTHELYRLYDEENRVPIGHDAIPASVRLATVAIEDAHFYSHRGIDPLAILRALVADIGSGSLEQGGSTITQQLARSLFLSRERTFDRKLREALLAIKIDHQYGKDQILDLYLNTVPYGANAYGIEAAAETYFHKRALDLSLDESALLASLTNAPSYFSPYSGHNEALRARLADALSRMRTLGFITDREYADAAATDTLAKIRPLTRPIVAPHFVFYVIGELEKLYSTDDLRTAGLRVTTTLDLDLQTAAERVVREGAAKNIAQGASNAALVSLDPRTGQVLAMVGSKDYYDRSVDGNVNVTLRARQPGSAFKPFAYATAFSKGFQPETPIYDVPIDFGPDGSGKDYTPRNYDGRFHGLLTMRQALAMSLNVPAVETLALAGVSDTIALATRLGITTLTDPSRYGLALVLGGAEVRPIDMASAFGVFGEEGIRHDLTPFLAITDGRTGLERSFTDTAGRRVLDPDIARKINSILSDNTARAPIFGAHTALAFPPGVVVAAKTGTTQNFRDAWTIGYTPRIAAAVWTGRNDNRPMHDGADGIFLAAPIFRAYMDYALTRFPQTGFTPYAAQPTATADPAAVPSAPLSATTLYFDKKTGREITEAEASKFKKSRVDKRDVNGFDPNGFTAPQDAGSPPIDLGTVLNFYSNLGR